MLEELSKKDKLWREIAVKICGGDKSLADDVVQEMYLRRLANDRGQEMTDYYIVCTMKSIFLNMKKNDRKFISTDRAIKDKDDSEYFINRAAGSSSIWDSLQTEEKFEPTDEEKKLIDRANSLPYTKRELLELNFDNSLRDIQSQFGINYVYIYRTIQDARKTILNGDMSRYNNKRLKHKKMKSKGLGDTIEKITKATGIKAIVELVANGKDCGCDKRKEYLNKLWSYKHKPNCLTEDQIFEYKNFVDTRSIKLTGKGKAVGTLKKDEVDFVTSFFSIVFNTEKWSPQCLSCSGTASTLISMIYKLDTVFVNNVNLPEKKDPKTTKKRVPTKLKQAAKEVGK
jgi:DNA-directed RNA polymerase specialized sigma24 family protein